MITLRYQGVDAVPVIETTPGFVIPVPDGENHIICKRTYQMKGQVLEVIAYTLAERAAMRADRRACLL